MILNDVTITYNDGDVGTILNVKYMDFDETTLTLNCIHRQDISIPMENIAAIVIERRCGNAGSDEETKYKSQVL